MHFGVVAQETALLSACEVRLRRQRLEIVTIVNNKSFAFENPKKVHIVGDTRQFSCYKYIGTL